MRNRVAPPFRGWKSVGGGKSGDGKNDRCWVWWRGWRKKRGKGLLSCGGEGRGGNTRNTGADVGNTEDAEKHRREIWKELQMWDVVERVEDERRKRRGNTVMLFLAFGALKSGREEGLEIKADFPFEH